jgi:hypothetical protein
MRLERERDVDPMVFLADYREGSNLVGLTALFCKHRAHAWEMRANTTFDPIRHTMWSATYFRRLRGVASLGSIGSADPSFDTKVKVKNRSALQRRLVAGSVEGAKKMLCQAVSVF